MATLGQGRVTEQVDTRWAPSMSGQPVLGRGVLISAASLPSATAGCSLRALPAPFLQEFLEANKAPQGGSASRPEGVAARASES